MTQEGLKRKIIAGVVVAVSFAAAVQKKLFELNAKLPAECKMQ
jgi:hypothetical protein